MRALLQRVKRAKVDVEGKTVGEIGPGLLLLLGVRESDNQEVIEKVAEKVVRLRIFEDEQDKMNHSVMDIGGEILVVSQFTLYGDTMRGRRPSFIEAAKPTKARMIYHDFLEELKKYDVKLKTGQFAAKMEVDLINDGPVTFMIEFENN